MSQQRIQWIDNEKGFVLLGVCIGHLGFSWNIFPYISSFHMAVFFFLSGLLFRPNRDWKEFMHSKCTNLLLPYVILSLFFLLLSPPLYQFSVHYLGSPLQNHIASVLTDNLYFHSLLVQLQIYLMDIINGLSAPYVTPLWFVFTLFQLNILWFFPIRYLSKNKYGIYALGAIAITCFILGWEMYMYDIKPLFNLSACVTASAFFIAGFIFGKILPYVSQLKYYWLLLLTLVSTGIYAYGTIIASVTLIGYNHNDLNENFLGYSAASWGGTFLLTLLFIIINRINKPLFVGNILRLISLNGIAILAVHTYILYLMRWLAKLFSMPFLAQNWIIAVTIILFCVTTLPFFNKYLYFCVGKKKPQ